MALGIKADSREFARNRFSEHQSQRVEHLIRRPVEMVRTFGLHVAGHVCPTPPGACGCCPVKRAVWTHRMGRIKGHREPRNVPRPFTFLMTF